MRKVLYTQYYRAKTSERQAEIDRCLEINLNHSHLDKVVVLREDDAPSIPNGTVACEVLNSNERLTYSQWLRLAKREPEAIALLVNSDIYVDQGLEYLDQVFDAPNVFLAMSRYNPEAKGDRLLLNKYPHWTQDTWGIRTDAQIPQSLLYASTFSLGFPGCDNRIAYVMWSYGFVVKNPGYFVKTVHLHQEESRPYNTHSDRLYGGVSYVHLNLSPGEASELEHTIWTQSNDIGGGLLLNQQSIGKGVHRYVNAKGTDVDQFKDLQKFTGLSWMHQARGSAQVRVNSSHHLTWNKQHLSNHTVGLSMAELTSSGSSLELPDDQPLLGLFLRLPRHSDPAYGVSIKAIERGQTERCLLDAEARIKGGGRRNFIEGGRIQGRFSGLELQLQQLEKSETIWKEDDLAELVLFFEKQPTKESPKANSSIPGESTEAATSSRNVSQREAPAWGDYKVIARQEFDASKADTVKRFGTRFEVLADGEALYFMDRFWPTVGKLSFKGTAADAQAVGDEILFAKGFLNPVLEWKPGQIASDKKHPDQLFFWQFPCRTEEDAFTTHKTLDGPELQGNAYQLYVGLPWATFIDRRLRAKLNGEAFPETLLLALRKRTDALSIQLRQWSRQLQVHSVCQHIRWREAVETIKSAGITDLWISHKEKGLDEEQGLKLHSWSLYAVNDKDPDRRQGLCFLPIEQRPVFASFSGAHMKHYLSDVRQKMQSLTGLEGYQVQIKDMWHFNKVVYNYQVYGDITKKNAIDSNEVLSYNELLSHTRFSLCPVGAGPNTLRLWESLAVGAIPVVLSDKHELPDLERLMPGQQLSWEEVVVIHPEANLDQLDARLRAISADELKRRQQHCRQVYEASVSMTCFGRSQRKAEPIHLLQELFKPQQIEKSSEAKAALTDLESVVPASMSLSAKDTTSLVLHLEKAERLVGFHLKAEGCGIDDLTITISRYWEHNKFEELMVKKESQSSDGLWLMLLDDKQAWAMGLKLTAKWKQPKEAKPEVLLTLAVLSFMDSVPPEPPLVNLDAIRKSPSGRTENGLESKADQHRLESEVASLGSPPRSTAAL